MPIVSFFGPDGSGKTSLAKKTAAALSGNGFKVKTSWMRGTHTFAYLFARTLRMHAAFQGSNHFMVSIPKRLKPIWRFLEFVSVMPVLVYRFILPNMLGFWVVGERYVVDFVVWVSIVTNDQDFMSSLESRILLSLTRKSIVNIYVTADIGELTARSSESHVFISSQQELYAVLSKKLNAFKIDTTHQNVESSFQQVYPLITQRIAAQNKQ